MIVKDESPVIKRCLASVKPLIDYWVIVDTGSKDGTQDLILSFMEDIPGELHERPWVNFAHNRNEAIALAKNKGDYLLFIDADEILSFPEDFKWPSLDKDYYQFPILFSGTSYKRTSLVNNHLHWQWEGVLHEYIHSPEAKTFATIDAIKTVIYTDGNRSQDPKKYEKDAALLERALFDDPTNSRYLFYLAQSYKDATQYEKALKNYQKRAQLKGWEEEVFWSLLQIGILQEELKYPSDIIIDSYYKAYIYRPSRIEPLYRIAHFHRCHQNYLSGYEIAKKGLLIQKPKDYLFVENWIYDYGLLLELSICAYWLEKYEEAYLASHVILKQELLPPSIRECVETNLYWINLQLQ